MLYPTRCKRIAVDQSKVLKNRLFRFFGPPGIYDLIVIHLPGPCIYAKPLHFSFAPGVDEEAMSEVL